MKKSLFTISLCAAIGIAQAASYRGMLTAPSTKGKIDKTFFIDIKYEVNSDNKVIGTYKSWQSGPCRGDRTISGNIQDDTLTFVTDKHELQGCGRSRFVGKKEGDLWRGHMSFNGGLREITFQKTDD